VFNIILVQTYHVCLMPLNFTICKIYITWNKWLLMMNMFIVLVFYQIILNIYPITYSLITLFSYSQGYSQFMILLFLFLKLLYKLCCWILSYYLFYLILHIMHCPCCCFSLHDSPYVCLGENIGYFPTKGNDYQSIGGIIYLS
jgi:hypothetical protein